MPAVILTETTTFTDTWTGGTAQVTVTVDDVDDLGETYRWNYHVENVSTNYANPGDVAIGIGLFDLVTAANAATPNSVALASSVDPDGVTTPTGWSVILGGGDPGSPRLMRWTGGSSSTSGLLPGESANFGFETGAVDIILGTAQFSDPSFAYACDGPMKVPGEKPVIKLNVAGMTDENKNVGAGKLLHVNDNFDEGGENLAGTEWVSDYRPDPRTGKHRIDEFDCDLVYSTLDLTSADVNWSVVWTVGPGVKVWYQEWRGQDIGTWKEVPAVGWVGQNEAVPARILLFLEGVDVQSGSVKAEFRGANANRGPADVVAYTVATGIRITGNHAQLARTQLAAANGWTVTSNAAGDVWRTGAAKTVEVWQHDVRQVFDEIAASSVRTTFNTVKNEVFTYFDSYLKQTLDTGDYEVAFAGDLRFGAGMLTHAWYEQYLLIQGNYDPLIQKERAGTATLEEKAALNAGFKAAHEQALLKEGKIVAGSGVRKENKVLVKVPDKDNLYLYEYQYDGGVLVTFTRYLDLSAAPDATTEAANLSGLNVRR